MGGPSGMTQPDCSSGYTSVYGCLKFCNLTYGPVKFSVVWWVEYDDAGTVVPTIFQSLKTLDYDWPSLSFSHISYYTAHGNSINLMAFDFTSSQK